MSIDTKALVAKIQKTAKKNALEKANKIERALASSRLVLLSFHEFMKVTGYKMDKYLVDKFFHSIKEDIPIYLDNELIKWCGYSGELYKQKQLLMNLIKKYNIPLIEFDNNEYDEFRTNVVKLYTPRSIQKSSNIDTKNEDGDVESESEEESKSDNSEDEFDTDSYNDVLTNVYPEVDRSNGKGKTKHILITPDDFRMLAMRLPTDKGIQTCRYYIEFEKLVKEYVNYQVQFLSRRGELLEIELKESREERRLDRIKYEQDRKKAEKSREELRNTLDDVRDELTEMHDLVEESNEEIQTLTNQLNTAVEDRVPQTANRSTRERFILMQLHDTDPEVHEFYVIRTQNRSVNSAINRLRDRFPNATRVLTIICQPNATNLYNRIKERLGDMIDYTGNYISPIELTHNAFIRRIHRINNERRNVD
jgi:hypothetical protein